MQSRIGCASRRRRANKFQRGQRWTRGDLLRLQIMLNAGYGLADIGRLISRSVDSIVSRESDLAMRLPQRRPDPAGRSPRA